MGSVDDAEADWNNKLSIVIDNYVKWKTPATPGPTPWWNKHCEKAFHWKSKCFEHHMKEPEEYHRAVSQILTQGSKDSIWHISKTSQEQVE